MIDLLSEAGFEVQGRRMAKKPRKGRRKTVLISSLLISRCHGVMACRFWSRLKRLINQTIVIICTGYGTVDTAVKAMKLGAFEYITKPIKLEEIKLVIERALDYQRLQN